MRLIFYHDKRSYNNATKIYIDVILESFKRYIEQVIFTNSLKNVNKEDIIFTVTAKYFFQAKLKYPINKTVFWAQGVIPEEYLLNNQKNLKYFLKNLIEYVSIKYSDLLFLVSDAMKQHYNSKYSLKLSDEDNLVIMPCFNSYYRSKNVLTNRKRYSVPSFVYAGSMAAWQGIDEMLNIFKEIQNELSGATLTLLTGDKETAYEKIKTFEVQNVEVDYVKLKDLEQKLSEFKYGFLIRDDIAVNNVATPTKMSSYLAAGLIPVYSNSVNDFIKNINLSGYSVVLDANAGTKSKADEICEFDKKEIDINLLNNRIKSVFDTYYNIEKYKTVINNKISLLVNE